MSEYADVQPLLRQVRVMNRFFRDVVDATPERRAVFEELHVGYMEILQEELAPHALALASAIVELEESFPAIKHRTDLA